jgi:hypothetical protein
MAVNFNPRSYQSFVNIAATPPDFQLDAGDYGLTATWTVGTVQLERLLPDGVTAVPVSAALAAPGAGSGYSTYLLPAGQYRLLFAGGVAGFSGVIEKINAGRR